MNQEFKFDVGGSAAGCVAARKRMTAEDIIYRVATVTAVLFILITML